MGNPSGAGSVRRSTIRFRSSGEISQPLIRAGLPTGCGAPPSMGTRTSWEAAYHARRAWSSALRSTSRAVRCGVGRPAPTRTCGPGGMRFGAASGVGSSGTTAHQIERSSFDHSGGLGITVLR